MKKVTFLLAISIAIISCTPEENNSFDLNQTELKLINNTLCNGNPTCNIEINEAVVIKDGCMVFNKQELLDEINNPPQLSPSYITGPNGNKYEESEVQDRNKQFSRTIHPNHMWRPYKIFYLHDFHSGPCKTMLAHANNAITDYNNLGTRIELEVTTDSSAANIYVGCDTDWLFESSIHLKDYSNMHESIAGRATKPTSFSPGKFISINDYDIKNHPYKKGLMLHEIGHCFGLAHSNDLPAKFVPCGYLEYTHSISKSVMTSPTPRNNFHHTDITTLKHLYPKDLPAPENTRVHKVNSNTVQFNFRNPDGDNKPYAQILILYKKNSSNTKWERLCVKPGWRNGYSIDFTVPGANFSPSESYEFWVNGTSAHGNVNSTYSYAGKIQ